MINPVIVKKEGEALGAEGCLSAYPDYEGEVKRAEYVECRDLPIEAANVYCFLPMVFSCLCTATN